MAPWLERNPFLLIALSGLLLLSGLAAKALLTSDAPPALVLRESALEDGAPIKVHVTGAVDAPGVYEMASGQRVEDAVSAAGGAAPGSDLSALNLARRLRDGEQIVIEGPASSVASFAGMPSGTSPAESATTNGLLDLNQATQEQLIALPGIGEAYSRRIVDSRAVDGPFASVDDVLARGLVPARTLETIRSLVTVSSP